MVWVGRDIQVNNYPHSHLFLTMTCEVKQNATRALVVPDLPLDITQWTDERRYTGITF